jgi:hypothetical protein
LFTIIFHFSILRKLSMNISQSNRPYVVLGALHAAGSCAIGLLINNPIAPAIGAIYSISKVAVIKAYDYAFATDNNNLAWNLARTISSWIIASGVIFCAFNVCHLPITFTACLGLGVGFEFFGGGFVALGCVAFTAGIMALQRLGMIDEAAVNAKIRSWTFDGGKKPFLAFYLMNVALETEIKLA